MNLSKTRSPLRFDVPPPSLREGLAMPIQYFKGVGPQKAELLTKLGVRIVEDLLYYYPREHQDRRTVLIRNARPGQKHAFHVEIISIDFLRVGKMLGQARARIQDASGQLDAVWFKRLSFQYDVFSWLKKSLAPGKKVFVYGALEMGENGMELKVEDHESAENGSLSGLHANRITPVYPLTEGLNDRWLRSVTNTLTEMYANQLIDPLPSTLRSTHELLPFGEAVRHYHFPSSWSERDRARERLAFDEFFLLELALAISRQEREQQTKGYDSVIQKTLLTPFKQRLGYEFTRAQTRVINEIFRDMQRPAPMNRLLQGDVGSGKTVVALSAALLNIENGRQTVFLAPTEILAGQHALSIAKFFDKLPVRWALLTGNTPKPERKKILENVANGRLQLLVGTHAILSEDVRFHKLGLAIVDEQHRFGVRQRAKLVMKSANEKPLKEGWLLDRIHPDVLIMTATPIPRTLALTLYDDLDVSVIDALPEGRSPVKTRVTHEPQAWKKISEALEQGHQAYVVFPLVEESKLLAKRGGKTVKAATDEYQRIQQRFPQAKVGLLHGQMPAEEKTTVMEAFRSGKISILVATPVIEVGIDVPNATVIAIVNPERFGLAQLHQLRGRVGRGAAASECLLVTESPEEEISERLRIFCVLSDGFRLAEEDLKLRGPGEFLGEAQHGIPFFRVGNLLEDGLLIARAREAAKTLVTGELPLTLKEFGVLNRALQNRFGSKIQLSRVG